MSDEQPEGAASSSDGRIEEIAESFLERLQRGESPAEAIEEYARAHPDLAEKIRELLPTLRFVEKAWAPPGGKAPTEPGGGGSARPPDRIGEYRIVREIGRGGMGIVFEAVQESLGRHVALKLLPAWAQLDARRLQRFREEARAAASLQHANIVQVYGIGEEGGVPYYVMQYIEGAGLDRVLAKLKGLRAGEGEESAGTSSEGSEDLAAGSATGLLSSQGATTVEGQAHDASAAPPPGPEDGTDVLRAGVAPHRYFSNVVGLGIQIAEAIAYAHEGGVLHRDIKPSNLILDGSGRVWITDFGLAKARRSDDLTRSGEILGTPRYMAPERLRGWSDPRSDIYGLGATLYELLTLRPAFDDDDAGRLLRKIAECEPVRPRRLDPRIPRDLEVVVLKAIASEPAERYQTGKELAEDLRRFLRGEPVLAHPTGAVRRSVKWARRRPAVAGLLAVTALAALTIFGLTLRSDARLREENEKARANLLDAMAAVKSMLVRFGSDQMALSPDASWMRQGLLEEANGFHRRFIERSPDDPRVILEAARVQRRLAEIQMQAGFLVDAGDALDRAIDLLEGRAAGSPEDGEIGKELESLRIQVRFLREGGRPAAATPVARYSVVRGSNITTAAAADLDSDGRPELLAAGKGTGELTVLRSNGSREFRAAGRYPMGLAPYRMILGHFGGKEGSDVAAFADYYTPSGVSLVLSRGDGTFQPPAVVPSKTKIFGMAKGDLDGDGLDELAAIGGVLQVIHGSPDGKPVLGDPIEVPPHANSIVSGDFDRDGNVDLVAGCVLDREGQGLLWVRWGDGKGGASAVSEFRCARYPLQSIAFDIDGDGDPDIAYMDTFTSRFAVARNEGGRSFLGEEPVGIPNMKIPMAAGDFDGDGDPDLALSYEDEGRILVLLNDGRGSFSPARPFLTGGSAFNGAAADVDGDGQMDLIIGNGVSDDVAVMYGLREHLAGEGAADGTGSGAGKEPAAAPAAAPGLDPSEAGSGEFALQFPTGPRTNPLDVAAADLDGDGRPELVSADLDARAIGVLRALGPREFYPVARLPVGLAPIRVIAAEVDGRSGPDIVALGQVEAKVSVLANRGGGTFEAPVVEELAFAPRSMACADLDGDGRAEIAVAGERLQVLEVGREGKLVPGEAIRLARAAASITAGDFDADGNLDLALGAAADTAGAVEIRWGDASASGDPGGTAAVSEFALPIQPSGCLAADLDADGRLVLVSGEVRAPFRAGRAVILRNEGGRGLRAGEISPLPLPAVPMASADFDGDGTADIAFSTSDPGVVHFLLGGRDGKPRPARPLLTGSQAWGGCALDLDGDGQADLVVAGGRWDNLAAVFRLREHLAGAASGGDSRKVRQ